MSWKASIQDHPHACGDKSSFAFFTACEMGSSPRVWGQVQQTPTIAAYPGIIPTRVGTRTVPNRPEPIVWDHPHACGDKYEIACYFLLISGSSPRVWGQAIPVHITIPLHGIIPTRVGTRLKKSRKIAVLQNQPLRFPLTFHRSFV